MEKKESKTTLENLQEALEKVKKEIQEKITNNKFEEAHPLIEIQRYLEKEIELISNQNPSDTINSNKENKLIPFEKIDTKKLEELARKQSFRSK